MTRFDSLPDPTAFSPASGKRDRSIRVLGLDDDGRAKAHPGSRGHATTNPPANLEYDIDEGILHIRIDGPLDLRCAFALLLIGRTVDDSIEACTLDLTGVDQVFDSGIAALVLVARELKNKGVEEIRMHGLDLESPTLRHFLM
jgi:ABC-type transporter Mla MlaB component